MAYAEVLKASEVTPHEGSSPSSGISKAIKDQQEINNIDSIKYDSLTRNPFYNEPEWKRQKRLLWCNAHQRRAERCKTEGGILIPCSIVDLTGMVEIDD